MRLKKSFIKENYKESIHIYMSINTKTIVNMMYRFAPVTISGIQSQDLTMLRKYNFMYQMVYYFPRG